MKDTRTLNELICITGANRYSLVAEYQIDPADHLMLKAIRISTATAKVSRMTMVVIQRHMDARAPWDEYYLQYPPVVERERVRLYKCVDNLHLLIPEPDRMCEILNGIDATQVEMLDRHRDYTQEVVLQEISMHLTDKSTGSIYEYDHKSRSFRHSYVDPESLPPTPQFWKELFGE